MWEPSTSRVQGGHLRPRQSTFIHGWLCLASVLLSTWIYQLLRTYPAEFGARIATLIEEMHEGKTMMNFDVPDEAVGHKINT